MKWLGSLIVALVVLNYFLNPGVRAVNFVMFGGVACFAFLMLMADRMSR